MRSPLDCTHVGVLACRRSAWALAFFALSGMLAIRYPLAAQALPAGSYQQSCRDVSIIDGTLLAQCRRPGAPLVGLPSAT
jgi:hypothetical protein